MSTAIAPTNIQTIAKEQTAGRGDLKQRYMLHWDGRLDNRNDLLPLLSDSLRGDNSNCAIVLAAYERWGIDGLVHLIGDWSVVIRDDAKRMTVLASDFAGVRPLYYSVQQGQVFWSSCLQSVVDATGISELDEQYIGAFLLYGGCPNRTPYEGIHSVPAGHAVSVSSCGTKIKRFWSLPVRDEVRYLNQHRYEEHLRALFREAVSVRLQTEAPVLAELSGGLDSSSVVSMANQLMRCGAVPARSLTSVSYVWKNSLDEPFARHVESFCGIKGVHISTHESPLISDKDGGSAEPEPLQPLRRRLVSLSHRVGAKVLLTGLNGDLMMGNWFDDSLRVAASFRRFRIPSACKEAIDWSKRLRIPIYRILWQAACASLPATVKPGIWNVANDGSYTIKCDQTSLAPIFVDRVGVSESGIFSSEWMKAPPERRKYFRALSTMLELRQLRVPKLWQHLDYTHPFAHRPLVEFVMCIPLDVLCRAGEPRKLMRAALSDLWPNQLRLRQSKGLFNLPLQESLRPLARSLLTTGNLQVVERGFVHREQVFSRLRQLSRGLDCNAAQLQYIVLLELWLRSRTRETGLTLNSQSV